MHVLSVEDIDLMIMLVSNQKMLAESSRHEDQMAKLIGMGIIRPGGGVLTLTDLGRKTASALLGRSLGSTQDSLTLANENAATASAAGAAANIQHTQEAAEPVAVEEAEAS